MIEDRKIDLHLLRCLDALLAEGSVTRAATRMDMSQPGMSNALARLREVFGDPLLVRTPKGMEPTERALEVRIAVRETLDKIEGALTSQTGFDPGQARLSITISTTDYASFVLMPSLLRMLEPEAPGLTITIRPPDPAHIREWLEEGAGELVIGFVPDAAGTLKSSTLYRDPLVCIARKDHPDLKDKLDINAYQGLRHVILGSSFTGLSTLERTLDDILDAQGATRSAGVRIPSALLSPHIVASTDMIATLPTRFVDQFRDIVPLQVFDLPFPTAPLPVSMIWHECTHQSGAMTWLRQGNPERREGLLEA
jgi:DNA-binding transcriptional LysR family regulator